MGDDVRRTIFDEKDFPSLFKWPEYCVFAAVLVLSLGIGVFFGFFDKKNKTNEEFLMASRSMSIFPVSLSLICSFISAITIMGTCVEVFYYGLIYVFFALSAIPMTMAVVFLYLPVFFNLQLTSAYEYFELRYSRRVRLIISISAIVHLLIYMPLTTWAPSLALERVAGINKYLSCAAIFIVCIGYSSIGGLKAVLWTDALQAIIMGGSVLVVIIVGSNQVGGLGVVWERAKDAERLDIWNFDADPRTRHTLWTGIIGAYFSWIPLFAGAQAQIQRYLAVPSEAKARQCMILNMLGMMTVIWMCSLLGLVIFAQYYNCDPASVKAVSSTDQLLPLFVMDVLGTFTGMPGLMVAGLTCGSLSSVSSALNALPAIIIEDYVKPYWPGLTDIRLGYLSKVISLTGGILSFSLVFVIALIGNVLPFASLLHGTLLGPVCALFTLGMLFPWSNGLGSIIGIICSLILTLFLGIGSIVEGNAGNLSKQQLPLRTDGCYLNETGDFSTLSPDLSLSPRFNYEWKDKEYSNMINVLGISYLWLPGIPVVTSILFGLIGSLIVNIWKRNPPVKAKYMTPIIVTMWRKLLGEKRVRKWIDLDDDEEDAGSDKHFQKSTSITYLNADNLEQRTSSNNNSPEKTYGSVVLPGAHELREHEALKQAAMLRQGVDNPGFEKEDSSKID